MIRIRCSRHLLFGLSLACALVLHAQDIMLPSDDYKPRLRKRKIPDLIPPVPTFPPVLSIPLAPLGYGPPGPTYLGRHHVLFSLDFLDETRLLVSFRAPNLMHRESGSDAENEIRQMRAIVLSLPSGKVETQTLWTVPGPERYVWTLNNGAFLLHDHDGLLLGNVKLDTSHFLQLAGSLLSLDIDPTRKIAVVNTLEPEKDASANRPAVVARVVDLGSGHVIKTIKTSQPIQSPINSEGFLNITHDKLDQWSLRLDEFAGTNSVVAHIESTCQPTSSFIAGHEVLIAGCTLTKNRKLSAVSIDNPSKQLWEFETPDFLIPPLFATAPDGSDFARETVVLKNPKPAPDTLWIKAVKAQVVRIYDSNTGKALLETKVSPPLDGGGNVAISPSGKRIAVLNTGAIQVFDLPAN
ncbi:MAG TPA: hypothetical protein VL967_03265 [Terracidiphilus sp.]|nr:hypothetical protein [Terracidiphilus sp.]